MTISPTINNCNIVLIACQLYFYQQEKPGAGKLLVSRENNLPVPVFFFLCEPLCTFVAKNRRGVLKLELLFFYFLVEKYFDFY